jgi:dTDP-4-amino-4,6-dideoxygalactose transaminase
MHEQPVFARRTGYEALVLPETERATREVLSLPVHPSLTDEELAYVVAEVNAAC